VQALMLVAYASMAVSGVLAWIGRRTETTFAAQWYAVAAIFLFPWLFSAAQVVLLWSPVRGTVQAVAAGWYAQGAWTLWLAPLGLAAAYYVVPKVTGKTLPSYEFAPHAFWCLLLLGAFTGGRHLVGGPVPAWIGSLAIVSCSLLLFHYFVVLLNLRGAFTGGGTALKFIAFGVAAYVAGGFLDAITAFRSVASFAQFTYLDAAQQQLALYGGCSMMLFGAIYFAVPRLTGQPWASALLVSGHRVLAMIGVGLLVTGLAAAGKTQGHDLLDAKVTFAEIATHTRTSLLAVVGAQSILLLGNIILLVNFCRSASACCCASAPAESPFRQPSAMEASV
jgi:cytochrome c oxidase cbb3-type subunit 1